MVNSPYTETKEALGGIYLIQVADIDEAVMIAHNVPVHHGSLEVARRISRRTEHAAGSAAQRDPADLARGGRAGTRPPRSCAWGH